MAGYEVGIASETKAFKQGVETGIIEPLEDAQKELVELGKSKGPDQLEKGMKDAEKATEKLGDETKSTARAIEQEFRDTYRKTKQSSDDATRGMSEGFDDVKQEAEQSAKETMASFDGSFESIIDMGQEVAAQAFSGFGPAGLAAGLAAAGGIGLISSEMQRQQEEAEKLRERLGDVYQDALASGRDYLDQLDFIAENRSLRFDPERADEWARLQEDAVKYAIEESTLIKASAGDLDAQRFVMEQIAEAQRETIENAGDSKSIVEQIGALEAGRLNAWKKINDLTLEQATRASEGLQTESNFLMEMVNSAEQAGVEIDDLGNRLITLEDGKKVLIEVDTGLATQNVDKFKGDTDEVIDQLNGREIVISTRAAVGQAQREINQFISQNDGRTIKINGRFSTNSGTWD